MSGPARTLLFRTDAGECYELDALHHVFVNGVPLGSDAPIAVAAPHLLQARQLRIGQEAALLFATPAPDGWVLRIHVTRPLVGLARRPWTGPGNVATRWLLLAVRHLHPATTRCARCVHDSDGVAG